MAFYGYKDDLDKYYCNDYYFSSAPIQESPQYSATPPESNYYEHYHSSYNHHEYYSVNEPPDTQPQLYFPSEPTLRISYSTVEFEEYDPTPYGGGYDQATTYGKPIPPSDITCYPRSAQKSDGEKLSYASIPSPYGKDGQDHPIEPPSGIKPENGDKVITRGDAEQVENGDKVDGSDECEIEFGNRTNGDHGYGGEITQVAQIPYGSGLEAMDICESLFGYWPCLAKMAEQERRKCFDQERRMNPWGSAVDYLFGSPLVYNVDGNYHQQDQYYESWENS